MEKIEKDNYSWVAKTQKVVEQSDFSLRVAKGVGQAVARQLYSQSDLMRHVSNKLIFNNMAREKEASFFGRLSNKLTGDDPVNITLDGIVIRQLHELIGIDTPTSIEISQQYKIEHENVRGMFAQAEKVVAENKPQDE